MTVSRRIATAAVILLGVATGALTLMLPVQAAEPADAAAIERTRKQVRMLDDLYKSAIVLITENYVDEESDLAAGDAFQALFKAMQEKGWHEVRLLDAAGEPIDDENLPRDEFEKSAIRKLKSGETFVDAVITRDGKPYLRAATPIPLVLQKCVMCHANYADVPKGQPIGALGYTVPIE